MGRMKLLVLFTLCTFCFIKLTICQEETGASCDFQTSETENAELLQPPAGCMSGSFVWHNPSDSVNIALAFPRSLLPSESRRKMKVCLRESNGGGVADMFQLIGWGGRRGRGRRPGELRLHSDTAEEAETSPWSCSRPSRRGVRLVLYADGDEQHEFQGLDYRVEEVQHSGKRPNRRPKKTRPGSSRRSGRRPGDRRPNKGNSGRNRRPNLERGGRNTFPLEHGEHPMRSYLRQEQENPDADS